MSKSDAKGRGGPASRPGKSGRRPNEAEAGDTGESEPASERRLRALIQDMDRHDEEVEENLDTGLDEDLGETAARWSNDSPDDN